MFENFIRRRLSRSKYTNIDSKMEKYNTSISELEELTKKLNEKDKELKEHYKLLEIENNILKMVAKGKDFYYILDRIIESIEVFDGVENNMLISILSFDKSTNMLYNLYSPNIPRDFLDTLRSGIHYGYELNSCFENGILEINNINADNIPENKIPKSLQDLIIKHGIKSYHVTPILNNNDMLGTVTIYYKDESYNNPVYKKLLCWASKIISVIIEKKQSEEQLNQNIKEVNQKNKLLQSIISASGGYLWMKDQNDRYQFSDYNYHSTIFGKKDKDDICGKTDQELFHESPDETGIKTQLEKISLITDKFTKEKRDQARFIVGGYSDCELHIYEVIKTPLFDIFGNYKGIIGFSWDRSYEIDLFLKDIQILKEEDRVKVLSDNEYPETPFVYHIIPSRKYYKKLISKPIYEDPTIIDKRTIIEDTN